MKAVEDMRKAGRDPYPHKFDVTHEIEDVRKKYEHLKVLSRHSFHIN